MAEKTRLPIPFTEMRKLLLSSGAYCAFEGCDKSLYRPSGAWTGTVAHIISAELDGPRGREVWPGTDRIATPLERASIGNLMLMCADHGREIDAPIVGEKEFPGVLLRSWKAIHERKINTAIDTAIAQEMEVRLPIEGVFESTTRPTKPAISGIGLLDALKASEKASPEEYKEFTLALASAGKKLSELSSIGRDGLARIVEIWQMKASGGNDYGNPDGRAEVASRAVSNRVLKTDQETFDAIVAELADEEDLLERPSSESPVWVLRSPWVNPSLNANFWQLLALYLDSGTGVKVSRWLKDLDFSQFDSVLPDDRAPWRVAINSPTDGPTSVD